MIFIYLRGGVCVLYLFFVVPWVDPWSLIVAFSSHTHILLGMMINVGVAIPTKDCDTEVKITYLES